MADHQVSTHFSNEAAAFICFNKNFGIQPDVLAKLQKGEKLSIQSATSYSQSFLPLVP